MTTEQNPLAEFLKEDIDYIDCAVAFIDALTFVYNECDEKQLERFIKDDAKRMRTFLLNNIILKTQLILDNDDEKHRESRKES